MAVFRPLKWDDTHWFISWNSHPNMLQSIALMLNIHIQDVIKIYEDHNAKELAFGSVCNVTQYFETEEACQAACVALRLLSK